MGQQTVIVLSNDFLDSAIADEQFPAKLSRAVDETVRTGRPAEIGSNYGVVMPYHHNHDATLYLSYGGKLAQLGSKTVEKLPHGHEECHQIARDILGNA